MCESCYSRLLLPVFPSPIPTVSPSKGYAAQVPLTRTPSWRCRTWTVSSSPSQLLPVGVSQGVSPQWSSTLGICCPAPLSTQFCDCLLALSFGCVSHRWSICPHHRRFFLYLYFCPVPVHSNPLASLQVFPTTSLSICQSSHPGRPLLPCFTHYSLSPVPGTLLHLSYFALHY